MNIIYIALFLLFSSCGPNSGPNFNFTPPPGKFFKSTLTQVKAPQLSKEVTSGLSQAYSNFSIDLFKKLAPKKGNLIFSPYSISTALAMTYAGARENTAQEIAKTMHFAGLEKDVHGNFYALNNF